jgi:hypothetical protein
MKPVIDLNGTSLVTNKSDDKDIQKASVDGLPRGQVMGPIVDFNMEIINTKVFPMSLWMLMSYVRDRGQLSV